ncbi:hypothetical protein CSKR_113158 [Clonorchis sinensis]|uniref:Uncharacterized protein n=1 Tax=Clonorchis sinensis TaxID=79923 RepID=A0A3R7FKW1_CLOSI|nr:hypothetical protein CSKR_113158 [Clonorchis sinensis]
MCWCPVPLINEFIVSKVTSFYSGLNHDDVVEALFRMFNSVSDQLGQSDNISAFVLPSGGRVARHRKVATAERSSPFEIMRFVKHFLNVINHTEWIIGLLEATSLGGPKHVCNDRMGIRDSGTTVIHFFAIYLMLFRYLAALPAEGDTMAGIPPGCSSLYRSRRDVEVGFEPRTFRSISFRLNYRSISSPVTL